MINVIVIEDIADYRNTLQSLLKTTDDCHGLAFYGSAEECLQDKKYPQADVALIDIQLPGISGIDLIRKLSKLQPGLLFMVCTAYEEDEKVFDALKAGAHGYLIKHASFEEIIGSIRELIKGGSPMSSSVARKVVEDFRVQGKDKYGLTKREEEILLLLSKGLLYKEVADKLGIGTETVRTHCFNCYGKLSVNNRTEAINKYFRK